MNQCEKIVNELSKRNNTINEWLQNARYYIAVKSTEKGWNGNNDEKRMREMSTALSNAYIAIYDAIDNLRKVNELKKRRGEA